MQFLKPALTIPEQAALLQNRGLIGDTNDIIQKLTWVNYYRLAAYWHTYKTPQDHFLPKHFD